MKLRIKGNAIRYRLSKTDVERFAAEGRVEETINFAGQPLKYILQQNNDDALSATYKDNVITMYMPVDMKNEWVDTEKVGFNNTCGDLQLLIEKDFMCLDDVAEDQSDNFPNPLAKK
ncbi:hypothetical protein EOD41_11635 [Mucilaginibacter limnophilus]|uniref:Uncharacterized protein n=1 Tax=Mucilaginibacter limnophilus TaxID=1932778 RepID=A0A3S2Y2V9_9SPHI|nr:hypothetical protein [Mucilaginibacter limnophilus]RVU00645.1 hypothetical protein EOD41_11635 [Mucilaginibacter limnophilus]